MVKYKGICSKYGKLNSLIVIPTGDGAKYHPRKSLYNLADSTSRRLHLQNTDTTFESDHPPRYDVSTLEGVNIPQNYFHTNHNVQFLEAAKNVQITVEKEDKNDCYAPDVFPDDIKIKELSILEKAMSSSSHLEKLKHEEMYASVNEGKFTWSSFFLLSTDHSSLCRKY